MACSCDLYIICCGRCCSFLITEKSSADAAFPVLLVSCVCAGRVHRFHIRECVACSCDLHSFCCSRCCSFLVTEKVPADAAFPVLLVSCFCAGRVHRLHIRECMACSCDLYSFTLHFQCSLFPVSVQVAAFASTCVKVCAFTGTTVSSRLISVSPASSLKIFPHSLQVQY